MDAGQLLSDAISLVVFVVLVRFNGRDPFKLRSERSHNPRI